MSIEASDDLAGVLAASFDAVLLLAPVRDDDGRVSDFVIREANHAASALTGVELGQLLGARLCELRPVNRTGGFVERYVRVLDTGEPLEERVRVEAPEGARWRHHHVRRVAAGLVLVSRDISEQVPQVPAYDGALGPALTVVSDLIFILDDNWVFRQWFGARDRLHMDPADFLGRSAYETMDPKLVRRLRTHAEATEIPFLGSLEYSLERDGATAWYSASVGRLSGVDGEPRWVFLVRDITEHHEAARQRAMGDELRLQTDALGGLAVLAGGVAHDFNNLLTVVSSGVTELAAELPIDSPLHEVLGDVSAAALRGGELVHQLLAFAGKAEYELVPADPSALVHGASVLLTRVASAHELTFELASDLPMVKADAGRIRQMLLSLVTNAHEAFEGGEAGHITIGASAVSLTVAELRERVSAAESPGRFVCLSVSDDGPGMTSAVRRRMFEPFFTTKFAGRGLGMAVVRGIVLAHRGALEVRSELGGGTTVCVYLPVVEGESTTVEHVLPQSSGRVRILGSARRLLVVDDEPIVLRAAARTLRRAGYEVTAHSDPEEALDLFARSPEEFDAVVLDLIMPNLTGDELLRQLRAVRPELPALFVTGVAPGEAQRVLSGLSNAKLLAKPYVSDDLLDAVSSL